MGSNPKGRGAEETRERLPRDKHLFTLTPGDVTHPKLAQLDELHIHLVMPKVVKESYDDLIQGETMTFSRFIEEVQGLQAGRPQSLTLL